MAFAIAAFCSATLAGYKIIYKAPSDKTPEEWQAIARADLDAVHAAIVDAHPGYIDATNPQPHAWAEQGYREAQALVPRIVNYDTMMSAVRYYVSGFRDGHLMYSDNIRNDGYHELVNGWRVDERNGATVVTAVMPGWKAPLPPLGAILLDCDGRSPHAIVAADVAPYIDRREIPDLRASMFSSIVSPMLAGLELKRCTFRRRDGTTLALHLTYRSVPTMDVWAGLRSVSPHAPDQVNRYDFQDGVLWIRAANFLLGPDQAKELGAMLKEVAALRGIRLIVFDTRENSGGDSRVGQQMIDAATGGLEFDIDGLDRLPKVYTQWRASDISIAGLDRYVGMMTERYGRSDPRTHELERLRDRMREARRKGQTWVDTPGEPRLTRTEIAARHGRLRRFDGTVAVITDGNCASACLDFVDMVHLIPGSVHLGRATASDTFYLEQARVTLPSGNLLVMPMKVWRNRVRGDNEVLVPDIPLDVDMRDDKAVRTAATAALVGLRSRPVPAPRP